MWHPADRMLVKDGMNPITVTVGPDHKLRDAAKRMTENNVGAAVVMETEGMGPSIITERDLLRAAGLGQDIDAEKVGDHLADRVIYAYADWSLEQAAAEMAHGHFRHVIVLDEGGEPAGILSMRDIVRCWVSDGATSDMPVADSPA